MPTLYISVSQSLVRGPFLVRKLSNLVRKKNKTYQIVWKTVFLTQNLFKLSILLLQISISRSADLFYQILWSANILFNVLWSASSKSLGNTALHTYSILNKSFSENQPIRKLKNNTNIFECCSFLSLTETWCFLLIHI